MSAALEQFPCTPWCTEDDHHVGYAFRGDQSCWGPMAKTIFSLEDHAPPIGADEIPPDATGMSVYAYQGWYQLPTVRMHVMWEPAGDGDQRAGIDHDFRLTPDEAIQLAQNLMAVVELIGGAE